MSVKPCFLFLLLFILSPGLSAQQTVGLFQNSAEALNGYTLFGPMPSTTTYLIDNCGELVHSWPSGFRPGLSTYLLADGTLLRPGNTQNQTFGGGGSGGIIQMIDWDGNVIWEYTISSSAECQHHDVEYLPNGNILAIAWDPYTPAEAIQAGRANVGQSLWAEKIIEIEPDLINGGGTIVWEWRAWDHLVQDQNPNADNFGNVADSPQLININYVLGNPNMSDWLHINGIDYNAALDQIVLSCHHFSEIWIIDHSTTTLEASGHAGGNAGKGGDLLYRWGNPAAYDQGSSDDQLLFKQHDANWIPDGYIDEGMIMVFNNEAGDAINQNYSTVNVIEPPVNPDGSYAYSGNTFAPDTFHWTYIANNPGDFYSTNISGANRLANGNTMICEGNTGRFFEVDDLGNTVWEYINPVTNNGIAPQGSNPMGNSVFRATRYAPGYSGLAGQDLTPQGYLESGSTFDCDLFTTANQDIYTKTSVEIYPNPAKDELQISAEANMELVFLFDQRGQKVQSVFPHQADAKMEVAGLVPGTYFIQILFTDHRMASRKILVQP